MSDLQASLNQERGLNRSVREDIQHSKDRLEKMKEKNAELEMARSQAETEKEKLQQQLTASKSQVCQLSKNDCGYNGSTVSKQIPADFGDVPADLGTGGGAGTDKAGRGPRQAGVRADAGRKTRP